MEACLQSPHVIRGPVVWKVQHLHRYLEKFARCFKKNHVIYLVDFKNLDPSCFMKLHSPPTFLLDSWGWTMKFSSEKKHVSKSTLGVPNWSPSYHYPLSQFPTRPWGVAQSIPGRHKEAKLHGWMWHQQKPPPLPVPLYPPVRLPLKTPHFLWAAHPVYLSGTSSLPSHMEPRHVSSLKVCLILLGSQQNGINPEVEELIVIVECPQKVDCLAPLFI